MNSSPYASATLAERKEYAEALAAAGSLIPRGLWDDGAPSAGKVLLALETGDMLGLHPAAAIAGLNVIQDKLAASSGLMSGVLRAAGHKIHVEETGSIAGGDYTATTTLIRSDDPEHPFVSVWTPQRAERAGLCSYVQGDDDVWRVIAIDGEGTPTSWQNYPESLCKARGVSENGRDGGQDALMGIRYTPEELGAVVDATGDVVAVAAPAKAAPAKPEPAAKPAPRKRATVGTQGTKRPSRAKPKAEEAAPAAEPETAEVAAPVATEPEPVAPEQIHDAESEANAAELAERQERARIAAEQEAAVLAQESTPSADDDAPMALQEPPIDGTAATGVPDAELSEEGWLALARSAVDLQALKSVWDRASTVSKLSKVLQEEIIKLKAELEVKLAKAAADAAAAATE